MTESIKLSQIKTSDTNPRQTSTNLLELSESMAEQGLIQPIIVRMVGKDQYECVVGSRRLAAAHLLGWKHITCIVQDYDDDNVAEIQLVENLQREDVHPMEEARAIKNMMDKSPKLTAKHIADRIGKTEKFVRQRHALNNLCDTVKNEFIAGKLNLAQANLFATVDHEKQMEVLKRAINGSIDDDIRYYDSATRVKAYIKNMFKFLDNAFFPRGLEYAGEIACSKCPHNSGTGNNLFDFEESDGAMCSNATCFQKKQSHFLTTQIADYLDFCKSIGQEKTFFIASTRYGTSMSITELALADKQYTDANFHRTAFAGYAQADPNPGGPYLAGLILPTSSGEPLEHDTLQVFDIVWACHETEAKEAPAAKLEAIQKELASIEEEQYEPASDGPTKEERKRQLSFQKYESEMALYNEAFRAYRWEVEQRGDKIERNAILTHWMDLVDSFPKSASVTDIARKATAFLLFQKSSNWSFSEHTVDLLADVLRENPSWVPASYTESSDNRNHLLDLLAAEVEERAKARTILGRNYTMATWEAVIAASDITLSRAMARTALGMLILPAGCGYSPYSYDPIRDQILDLLPISKGLEETIAESIPVPVEPEEPTMPEGYADSLEETEEDDDNDDDDEEYEDE